MTKGRPNDLTRKQKDKILQRDGYICVYCLGLASDVDHIIPWDWNHDNSEDNLVASCSDCNHIATDKMFSSFEEKYEYINMIRKTKHWQKKLKKKVSVCTTCKKTFMPRVHGSTLFLCSECVDKAYEEK